jgi:hypothetical protein
MSEPAASTEAVGKVEEEDVEAGRTQLLRNRVIVQVIAHVAHN